MKVQRLSLWMINTV
ncbi:hypothetical protein, partial [Escherichia coli]